MHAGSEGAIRLTDQVDVDTEGAVAGVLEVFHAGAWGTVCEKSAFSSFAPFDYATPTITEVRSRLPPHPLSTCLPSQQHIPQ